MGPSTLTWIGGLIDTISVSETPWLIDSFYPGCHSTIPAASSGFDSIWKIHPLSVPLCCPSTSAPGTPISTVQLRPILTVSQICLVTRQIDAMNYVWTLVSETSGSSFFLVFTLESSTILISVDLWDTMRCKRSSWTSFSCEWLTSIRQVLQYMR